MRPATLLVWTIACAIWSTVWLAIKIGVTDVPPVTFAACRLALGAAAFAVIIPAAGVPLPRARADWWLIAVSGILVLGANYVAIYWGAQFISSGLTAVLQGMTPVFAMVLAHRFTPGERMTAYKCGALLLGVAGVAVLFADQLELAGWPSVWGSVAVLAGGLFAAIAYTIMKNRATHLSPAAVAFGQMLFALVPVAALGAAIEGQPWRMVWSRDAIASLLYLAVFGSVLATWLSYWLLRRMSATKVLLMALVEPPVALLLGAILLGETMSPRLIVGTAGILVSAGMVLEVIPTFTRAAQPQ